MARARGSRAAEVGRLRGVSRETSVARDNVVIGIHRGRGGEGRGGGGEGGRRKGPKCRGMEEAAKVAK